MSLSRHTQLEGTLMLAPGNGHHTLDKLLHDQAVGLVFCHQNVIRPFYANSVSGQFRPKFLSPISVLSKRRENDVAR